MAVADDIDCCIVPHCTREEGCEVASSTVHGGAPGRVELVWRLRTGGFYVPSLHLLQTVFLYRSVPISQYRSIAVSRWPETG